MSEVKKAIIPVAGKGTRFLPLSKATPKELVPLAGKPLVHYSVAEAKAAGANEVVFVVNEGKRASLEQYFTQDNLALQELEEKQGKDFASDLRDLEEMISDMKFSYVVDSSYSGDGHAILQARKYIKDEPCFIFYPDDIIDDDEPASCQLAKVFKTSQKTVIGLSKVSPSRVSSYGVVKGTTVTNRVYKLQEIVEKPEQDDAPSNLAVVGRSIITPDIFDSLERRKEKLGKGKELRLTEAAGDMVNDGQAVYGYELRGKWWECGDRESWMRSFLYFSLSKENEGGDRIKFLKDEKVI